MSSSHAEGSIARSEKSATKSVRTEKSSCGCCCCTIIAIVFILLAVAGILFWQLGPFREVVDSVVPGASPTSVTDGSPSSFQFFQCKKNNTDDCCNGLDNICDLKVNEVLFAGTHNSYSSTDMGFPFLLANQGIKLENQLKAGVRSLNLDLCGCGNEIVLCHNSCLVTRNTKEIYASIVSFLDRNPTEILLITMELNSDLDQAIDLDAVYAEMQTVEGFVEYLYVHSEWLAPWPTMRELKEAGTRILIFHYRGPMCITNDPCPDGLHYWFANGFETPYEFESIEDITSNYESSCVINRGTDGTKAFFGVNQFTSLPVKERASQLGTSQMLEKRISSCSEIQNNQPVSVILVDFVEVTDLLQVTQKHNSKLARRLLN